MPSILHCPGCGAPLRVREEHAGKNVKCPKCTHVVAVPPAAPEAIAPAPPRPAPPPLPAPVEDPTVTAGPGEATVAPLEEQDATEVMPAVRPRTRVCPACGARNPAGARRCQSCREPLGADEDDNEDEDEEERRPRRRPVASYKPCPRCGARGATRVVWTFWGSFYGPALLTHVRCPECRQTYNGRTGRSNLAWAILFVTIPAILIAAILGGLGLFLMNSLRRP